MEIFPCLGIPFWGKQFRPAASSNWRGWRRADLQAARWRVEASLSRVEAAQAAGMSELRIAVRAAMTGHLVLSTLHTNDAPEAIATLRNMDVPSYLISSALTAVIGQRLVRTICKECRAAFTPNAQLLKSIGLPATVKKLYRGTGCDACYRTGNRGRTGIFDILEIKADVRKLIAADAGPDELAKAAKLKTMAQHCREKVKEGSVEPEEFLKVIRT